MNDKNDAKLDIMHINVEKWHHLENSFLFIDATHAITLSPEQISTFCEEHHTDGMVFYQQAQDRQKKLEVTSFFNNDGSLAKYCGNAHVCLATLAFHLEIPTAEFASYQMSVSESSDDVLQYKLKPFNWKDINIESFDITELYNEEWDSLNLTGYALEFGVPHVVFFLEQKTDKDVIDFMVVSKQALDALQNYAGFSQGTNVTFVFTDTHGKPTGSRTYERGVNRFTASCGSGIMSSLVVLLQQKRLSPNNTITWHSGPNYMRVNVKDNELWIISKAVQVETGTLELP